MKRSASAAQLAYPNQYRQAKYRRVASRLNKITIPEMQRKQTQQIALQTVKRYVSRHADKKATQDYSGLISVSSTGGIGDLFTNMVRGDNNLNNFEGSKVTPTSLVFNYFINFTPQEDETLSPFSSMRFMIIQDNGGRNNDATSVDWYMDITFPGGAPQLAHVSMENNENWRCLYDSGPITTCTDANFVAGIGLTKTGVIRIPKRDLRTVYYGDSGDGVFVERNAIRVLFWSDSAASPHPTFQYNSHIDFTDAI